VTGESSSSATQSHSGTLSRELRDLLIQLSIAIHRYGMYPEGHPSVGPTLENVLNLLSEVLAVRATLSIGVARSQLVIEGVATDPKNAVLLELSSRMHRHHVGAVTFRRGVLIDELHQFLTEVAQDPDRTGKPLGLDPRFRRDVWAHIRPFPLNYERLRFSQAGNEPSDEDEEARTTRARSTQLWLGLARAALARESVIEDAPLPEEEIETLEKLDPTELAEAIASHQRDSAYDQVIVGYMLQIADELKAGQSPESAALRKRISKLIAAMDRTSMGQLLEMGGDAAQRRRFLLNAAEGMTLDAVLELVQAAAGSEQQTISHSLLRMLQKLARHAEGDRGKRKLTAETSVREQVLGLIHDWALHDPNPDAYRLALQRMSTAMPLFAVPEQARFLPEARRVFQMALELGVVGPAVDRAVAELLEKGELKWMLEALQSAALAPAAAALRERIVTPSQLEAVLAQEPLSIPLLDRLLDVLGVQAADTMLDALIRSENSQTRRVLIERLMRLGPDVAPAVIRRLVDDRWFVQRNMLALLGEMPVLPADFDPSPYMAHADGRVRREALRLLLRSETNRDRAICLGLADTDDHCVRLALTGAARSCPEAAVPLLVARATTGTNVDQRVAAIRVAASTGHPAALEALLQIAAPRRRLLRMKAPPKSKEYLAALGALSHYPTDPRAREALAVAARSRDSDIAQAALRSAREVDAT
jgi:hypothetical protein